MIQRFYVHNYRSLENFELPIAGKPSSLLIGKNGSGKSTIGFALSVMQSIARSINRVGDLVKPSDFSRGRTDAPMRFEMDVRLKDRLYQYRLALEFPLRFRELRVKEEQLLVDGQPIYTRDISQVSLTSQARTAAAPFLVDWHFVALPIIQEQSLLDPISIFKRWLAQSIILAPVPSLMGGESSGESLQPRRDALNIGEWFAALVAHSPAAYADLAKHLKTVLADFKLIKNPLIGTDTRSLSVQFAGANGEEMSLSFGSLSDGEKCFFLCALVIAANEAYGPVFCFWDEPDSHLSINEVQQFVTSLRRSFEASGQILIASHNAEAIRAFSDENTFVVFRRSHFEPTQLRLLEEIDHSGDLIDRIVNGELEP